MIIKSDLDKSNRDKMNNTIDKDTKKKKLRIINLYIKIYNLCISILPNSSIINFIKKRLILSPILLI